jgi:hypothetical protein
MVELSSSTGSSEKEVIGAKTNKTINKSRVMLYLLFISKFIYSVLS